MQVNLNAMGKAAKQASRVLVQLSTAEKNAVLKGIANALAQEAEAIIQANQKDLNEAKSAGLSDAMLDRLKLDQARLDGIIGDIHNVCQLDDPVGQVLSTRTLDSGLKIEQKRTPLGVVGVIYEARPNVTVDVATLCLKTGNAVILRGGKETLNTNLALMKAIQNALKAHDLPETVIQLIPSQDRQLVKDLLKLDRWVDMIIPRGGAGLHQFCKEESLIPVITGGIGVCHLYADAELDVAKAVPVIHNAKVQRPTVCNALDTLLVHPRMAPELLPPLAQALGEQQVEIRACEQSLPYFKGYPFLKTATEEDFGVEFLSLVLSVKVVSDVDAAMDHIAEYSSGHSDGILTLNTAHALRFLNSVDSAAVYHNASTRFTDGAQFGLGAEVAVSTQKLHARGPMALEGLTTYKWVVQGEWHSRP